MKKSLKIILIIVGVIIGFFIASKLLLSFFSGSCSSDADCVFYEMKCCGSCSPSDSINKIYEPFLEIGKIGCFPIMFNCPSRSCALLPIFKPYCNEQKECGIKIDCENNCNLLKDIITKGRTENKKEVEEYLKMFNNQYKDECKCEID